MSWAEVKKINNDLSTPLDVTLGNRNDAAGTEAGASLFSFVKSIWGNVNRGAVKSVQRGVVAATSATGSTAPILAITVAAVNLSKSVLIVNGFNSTVITANISNGAVAYVYLSSATTISRTTVFTWNGTPITHYYPAFAWQIVEFY